MTGWGVKKDIKRGQIKTRLVVAQPVSPAAAATLTEPSAGHSHTAANVQVFPGSHLAFSSTLPGSNWLTEAKVFSGETNTQ